MKKLVVGIITFLLFINVSYALDEVKLSKCVDLGARRIIKKNKEYTVRMLAIDTPESVHPDKKVEYYGKEASEYTCNIVSNAKKIELEYDSGSDKTDKYDRLLAWVIVDGELLQDKLVSLGYAKVAFLYGDYKYTSLLEEQQELASAKNLGIWNQQEKDKFDNNSNNTDNNDNNYSTQDIVMIVILLLVITFVGDKTIKRKAKKKLNKYLK